MLHALYRKIPLSLRDRLRFLKDPAWAIVGSAMWRATNGRTASGPFAGLRLPRNPHRPTLVGTYELEIHEWVERLIARGFLRIVNVGGGSGYYAVGFALRCPAAHVTVFESDERSRNVLTQVVNANGVSSRVDIRGEGTGARLEVALGGGDVLLIVDIEGGERDLLDPTQIPSLIKATILVETHDVIVPGCEAAVRRRFASSHRISTRVTHGRTAGDFPPTLIPAIRRLFPVAALESLNEFRGGPQTFLLLEPN